MMRVVVAILCGAQSWTWSGYIFWVKSPYSETCCPVRCLYSSFGIDSYAAYSPSSISLMSTQTAYKCFEDNAVFLLLKLHCCFVAHLDLCGDLGFNLFTDSGLDIWVGDKCSVPTGVMRIRLYGNMKQC